MLKRRMRKTTRRRRRKIKNADLFVQCNQKDKQQGKHKGIL